MAKIENIFKSEVKKADPHPKRVTKWIHYSKLNLDQGNYRFGESEEKQKRTRERAESLADLIELDGEVLQELIVSKTDTDSYQIIAGNHRYLACKILVEERGKEKFAFLPCVIRNVSEVRASFSKYSSNGYDNKDDYEIMCEIEQMRHLLTTYPEQFPDVATGRMVEKLSKKMKMPKSTVGDAISESNGKMKEMVDSMHEINDASQEIDKIIATINEIASQTNLLALNASIEAARAGEAGKGFAVVANQVNLLADQSAHAAKESAELIETSVKAVEKGMVIAGQTATQLEDVAESSKVITGEVTNIAETLETQTVEIQQINQGIEQINDVVQSNAATSEECAAASQEMSSQAESLRETIRKFKVAE